MKPIMKKWLTGLLCASLLAGSAPVYGADFSAETDFSSEIFVEETQEEDQTEPETPSEPEAPAEVDLEQPDDFSSQDGQDPAETPDPDAPSDDFSSDDLISDDSEVPEVQITDETEDQKEYLTDLNVYTGNGVKDALKLDRREDMDEEFGGRVYTVLFRTLDQCQPCRRRTGRIHCDTLRMEPVRKTGNKRDVRHCIHRRTEIFIFGYFCFRQWKKSHLHHQGRNRKRQRNL